MHGAAKVIAIEADRDRFALLCENMRGDNRVAPLNEYIGMVKVDIEGAEEGSMIATHNHLKPIEKHVLHGVEHIYKIEPSK